MVQVNEALFSADSLQFLVLFSFFLFRSLFSALIVVQRQSCTLCCVSATSSVSSVFCHTVGVGCALLLQTQKYDGLGQRGGIRLQFKHSVQGSPDPEQHVIYLQYNITHKYCVTAEPANPKPVHACYALLD